MVESSVARRALAPIVARSSPPPLAALGEADGTGPGRRRLAPHAAPAPASPPRRAAPRRRRSPSRPSAPLASTHSHARRQQRTPRGAAHAATSDLPHAAQPHGRRHRAPPPPSQRRPRPPRRATRAPSSARRSPRSAATSSISVPRSAVIVPQRPASAASIACRPKRVASTRSKAVGVPPRWTWPRTVARVSLPVRRSISPSSQWAIPPRRTWPKASSCRPRALGHPADRLGALGDDDDRREVAVEAAADQLADPLEVERQLGDQDHVGAAGEPGVEGDPAGVAAHHLDDQHPVVAVGGRVEAVDRLHRDVDRGVEAEGVVGGAEVVVDRLRHADDRRCRASSCRREAAPSVSSPPIAISPSTPSAARFSAIRSAPPSSAKGLVREEPRIVPPRGRMPRTSGTPSGRAVALQRTAPAVAVADELVPVAFDPLADDRPDHRVQSRAVAAAGEHADAHRLSCRHPRPRDAIGSTAPEQEHG